jgi:hypothetical protein
VKALVRGLADVAEALARADPADKAAIYDELGITLAYHPGGRVVVETQPCTEERVGGGFRPPGTPALRGELVLAA